MAVHEAYAELLVCPKLMSFRVCVYPRRAHQTATKRNGIAAQNRSQVNEWRDGARCGAKRLAIFSEEQRQT